MNIRPLQDRVVVRRTEEEKTSAGGIVLPGSASEKPAQGEVIAVGPGKRQENCDTQLGLLPGQIVATLDGEIDKDQAQLFSRRFQSVIELLEKQAAMFQEAVLLLTGLIIRTHQILHAPGPRALRVRAVVDFYYTQAAIIHHRPEDPSLVQNYQTLIDKTPWQALGNGASWKKVEGLTQFGPIYVNVLKLTKSRIRAVDCRTHASGLSLEDFSAAQNALAAVSG